MTDKQIQVFITDKKGQQGYKAFTPEEYKQKNVASWLDENYPQQYQVRVLENVEDGSEIDEGANYNVRIDSADGTYGEKEVTGKQLVENMSSLTDRLNDGQYKVSVRKVKSYNTAKGPFAAEERARLKTEMAALRGQIDEMVIPPLDMEVEPHDKDTIRANQVAAEAMVKRSDLRRQLKDLESQYYNLEDVQMEYAQGAESASAANETLDKVWREEMAQHRSDSDMAGQTYNQVPSLSVKGPEYDYKNQLHDAARRLNKDTQRLYEAPSKYGPESGIKNFFTGAGARLSDPDFWTMGLSEYRDSLGINKVFDKIQELGGLENLTPEDIDKKLSPLEAQVLEAYFRNVDAQAAREEDLSLGYQSGQTAADSLSYMASFAMSGAAAGAITSGATKAMSQWIAKRLGKEVVEKVAKKKVLNLAGKAARETVETGLQTMLQPHTYANYQRNKYSLEAVSDDPADGLKLVKQKNEALRSFADSYIETISEKSGNAFNWIGGKIGSKIGGTALMNAVKKTKFGRIANAFMRSDVLNLMKAGGWNGYIGEMAEEFFGDALRTVTQVDPEALKNATEADNLMVMATSFLPMTMLGGIGGVANYAAVSKEYGRDKEYFQNTMQRLGFEDSAVQHAIDVAESTGTQSPEQIAEVLKPLAIEVARRGADPTPVYLYGRKAAQYQLYRTGNDIRMQEDRDTELARLEAEYGGKIVNDKNEISIATLPDGREGVVVATGDGESLVKTADGSVGFVADESQVQAMPANEYLDSSIYARRKAEDDVRVEQESAQKIQAASEAVTPGVIINFGTAEAPVTAKVLEVTGGVAIAEKDGKIIEIPVTEAAQKAGIDMSVYTQEEQQAQQQELIERGHGIVEQFNAQKMRPVLVQTEQGPVQATGIMARSDENGNVFVQVEVGDQEMEVPYEQVTPVEVAPESDVQQEEAPVEEQTAAPAAPLDFRGNPLPMRRKKNGEEVVDEAALWNKDPEAFAVYNDANPQRAVDTKTLLEARLAEVSKTRDKVQKALQKEILTGAMDGDKMDEYQDDLSNIDNRIKVISSVLEKYNKAAEVTQTIGEQQRAAQAEQVKQEAAQNASAVAQKYASSPKVYGFEDEIVLPNGESVRGRYVLVEAEAPTASHDPSNGFAMSAGFPVDENGKTVNDRDYERDSAAQQAVVERAAAYDQRALQTPVIVSSEGIVVSGNDRTMSGQLAARNNTDSKYVDYLASHSQKYGIPTQEVGKLQHPRVVFELADSVDYTAAEFAKYNAEEKKSQSKTEKAVKAGKIVSPEGLARVAGLISQYEDITEFYASSEAVDSLLSILVEEGVISADQLPAMKDGARLSGTGMDVVESMLVGSVLTEDALRNAMSDTMLRKAVVSAMSQILTNRAISGYNLTSELSDAVNIVYLAKQQKLTKYGESVQDFIRQQKLFGDDVFAEATVQLLADALNNKKLSFLKAVLDSYNAEAQLAAEGVQDVFSGEVRTKEEILNDIFKTLGYEVRTFNTSAAESGTAAEQSAASEPGGEGEQAGDAVQGDAAGTEPAGTEPAGTEPAAGGEVGGEEASPESDPRLEKVAELQKKLGVEIVVFNDVESVDNAAAKAALRKGKKITGWFDPATGKVGVYLPNNKDASEITATYVHEVVAHRGVREVLGERGFENFLSQVWNGMSLQDQTEYLSYTGVKDWKDAADEYVAAHSEKLKFNPSIWSRITSAFKSALSFIGIDLTTTDDVVADALRLSYRNLRKEAKAKASRNSTSSMAAPAPEEKIEDFGEKIGGARKDMARSRIRDSVKLSGADLKKLNDPDKILSRKQIIKYLSEGQMTNDDAQVLLAANMAVRSEDYTYKEAALSKYRDLAVAWERGEDLHFEITDKDVDTVYEAYSHISKGVSMDLKSRIRQSFEMTLLKAYEDYLSTYRALNYPSEYRDLKGTYVRYGKADGRYWVVSGARATRGFPKSSLEQAISHIKERYPVIQTSSKSSKKEEDGKETFGHLHVVKSNYGGYGIKSRDIPGEIFISSKRFPTKKMAEEYLKENAERLIEKEQKMAESLMGSNIGMVERQGKDYRDGKDVTPQDFLDTFGFRGVEFGNWVPQAERQMYLNKSYDAIMDFCEVVGISPKAFSLGGRLGLAFGSRGKSRALAHYEPMKEVINLTRMKGAGSLAHEWFHALDNYLAKEKTGNTSDMATASRNILRPELSEAFSAFVKKMNGLAYTSRSKRAGAYWGEVWERAARLFENYVYNELGGRGTVSPLLVRQDVLFDESEMSESSSWWPYPSERENAEMKPYFDAIFTAIQEQANEDGSVTLFREKPQYDESVAGLESLVERVYRTTGVFSFSGKEQIESRDDVAYIFRQLEDSAVENAFLVLVKDGKPTILHVGMGSVDQTLFDNSAVLPAYKDFGADKVYVVHNHPSGALIASQADIKMINTVQNQLGGAVAVEGIIIDTVSGEYGLFTSAGGGKTFAMPSEDSPVELEVLTFDKNVFAPDYKSKLNANRITGPQSVAAFLSAHRLGEGTKVGALLLNRNNVILGNLVTNDNEVSVGNSRELGGQIAEAANRTGATSVVLFGDFDYSDRAITSLSREISTASGNTVSMLDVVRLEGEHTQSLMDQTLPSRQTLNDGVMFREIEITPEVRQEMNRIGALALLNGMYLKAPNGADSNLAHEQWLLVRTENFKKWFGEFWEENALLDNLLSRSSSIMGDAMIDSIAESKVLDSVIASIPVNVVNNLGGGKRAAQVLLHNIPVFVDIMALSSTDADIFTFAVSAMKVVALTRAKLSSAKSTSSNRELFSALDTLQDNLIFSLASLASTRKLSNAPIVFPSTRSRAEHLIISELSAMFTDSHNRINLGTKDIENLTKYQATLKKIADSIDTNASKVVDENGEPMVVYHGTNLTVANKGVPFWTFYEDQHFGTKAQAEEMARAGRPDSERKVYEVFLNIRNMKRVKDAPQNWKLTHSEYWEPIFNEAKADGYDGLVYLNEWEDSNNKSDSFVVFEPSQIKSATDNTGEFSGENEDIRFRESDKRAQIDKLRNSSNAEISGNEIASPEKITKKLAFDYGKNLQGSYRNEDTGVVIQLQRGRKNGGIKEVLQHNYKDVEHLQSVAAIPQIIEKSIYIDSEPNRDTETNPDVVEYQHYVCGLKIGDVDYTVHSLVAVDKKGERYYDHNLTAIEKTKLLDLIENQAVDVEDFDTTSGTKPTILSDYKYKQLVSLLQEGDSDNLDNSNISEGKTLYREVFGGNSGYVGYSMSKRAASARNEGRFPKTDFKKEYGVTEASLKALVSAGIIRDNEWHHTSSYGNKTTFYGWDEEVYAEVYADKKKQIDKLSRENKLEDIQKLFEEHPIAKKAAREGEKSFRESEAKRNKEHLEREAKQKYVAPAEAERKRKIDAALLEDPRVAEQGRQRFFEVSNGVRIQLPMTPYAQPAFVYPGGLSKAEKDAYREVARKEYKDFLDEIENRIPLEYDEDAYNDAMAAANSVYEQEMAQIESEFADVASEDTILYREVTAPETLERLNSEPTIKVYRAMQVIDGKLYPPMSAREKVETITKSGKVVNRWKLRTPIELGKWEEAEERPEMVREDGTFILDKGNGSTVPAAYNPYFHTSRTPLNDQFASAQSRPNLVTVEVEVPESELTSDYKAEKAKDSVGEKEWKAGVVQGKLSGTRKVILTRWNKPVRIVPDSEVADRIVEMFEGKDIVMPSNVVTPSLRAELEERGVPFIETDNNGNPVTRFREDDVLSAYDAGDYRRSSRAKAEKAEKAAQLTGMTPEFITREDVPVRLGLIKGYAQGDKVYVIADNCNDSDDAVSVVLSEAAKRAGLRPLLGEGYADFLKKAFAAIPDERKEAVAQNAVGQGLNLPNAVEEYLSEVAEDSSRDEEFRSLSALLREGLSARGIETSPADNVVRWILWNAPSQNRKDDLMGNLRSASFAHRFAVSPAAQQTRGEVEDLVRFREIHDHISAADIYNTAVTNWVNRVREVDSDMYQSVNLLMEAIETATGRKAEGYEDIRTALVQQSSKGLRESQDWEKKYFQPLRDIVKSICETYGVSIVDVERYIMTKHGLERNEVFAKRDARAFHQAVHDKAVTSINNDKTLTEEQKDTLKEKARKKLDAALQRVEAETDAKYKELRKNDYGGLVGLYSEYKQEIHRGEHETQESYNERLLKARKPRFVTADGKPDVEQTEDKAYFDVKEFENKIGGLVDELWDRINKANKSTLNIQFKSGLISRAQLESLTKMFKYYVPLRGFKDTTAGDMYDYYTASYSGDYTAPLRRAAGRSTVAESPFGYIGAMASSAIASAQKNRSKLALYYFIQNRPDQDLAAVTDTWYEADVERNLDGSVKRDENGTPVYKLDADGKKIFRPAFPSPELLRGKTADEVKQVFEDFEKEMKQKQMWSLAFKSTGKQKIDYVIHADKSQLDEHIVSVKVLGQDKKIYINGNPRAAQAINQVFNLDANAGKIREVLAKVLRFMSAMNTSYDPTFAIGNFQRDLLFALMSISVKENSKYNALFIRNLGKAFTVFSLKKKDANDRLGSSDLEERYREFVEHGGITGYTVLKDNEEWEKQMKKFSIKESKIAKGIKAGLEGLQYIGESLEQVTRFAVYMTSREMERDIRTSIANAKDVTVNFNRKGSGKGISWEETEKLTTKSGKPLSNVQRFAVMAYSHTSGFARSTLMFYNASMQALNTTINLYKANPLKMGVYTGAFIAFGALFALLDAMGGGDDDDQNNESSYLDIPDYERRSNLMIGRNGVFFKWSLPQEMRAFYALGDIIVNKAAGREPDRSLLGELASVFLELLPVNPAEGLSALIPSYLSPIYQAAVNKDFTGAPIYKDFKYLSDEEQKDLPAYLRAYPGTPQLYVTLAQVMNELSGGDQVQAGWININPAVVQHLVEGYTGGVGRLATQFINLCSSAAQGEPIQFRHVPFASRVISNIDERNRNSHTSRLFYYYKNEAELTKSHIRKYYNQGLPEKAEREMNSKEYQWLQIYEQYAGYEKMYQQLLKDTTDETERKRLMREQDAYREEMIKEISELK